MSVRFERKLPLILFFVFLLLTAIGFVLYRNSVAIQSAIIREKHTQEILLLLDDTFTQTLDISTATNNFVIVGNDTYLEPYNRAKPKIAQNISTLRRESANNQTQLAELDALESLLADFVQEAERKVLLRKSGGYESAIVELPVKKGSDLSIAIRESIERLKAEEMRDMKERGESLDSSLRWSIWVLIVGSVAGLISLAIVNFVVRKEIGRRRSAEGELSEVNAGLEKRIEERTRELQQANENLRLAGAEREQLLINEKKARKEAEIATRLRDEFMATVSHELRTPLNSILGWARLLKGGSLDGEQSSKAVGTIIKNAETQNHLIEDLLDVARIISGNLELNYEDIDPLDLLNQSVDIIRPSASAKHITLETELPAELHSIRIKGDRERLQQVFTNLLTNAVKFSPERAAVMIKAETLSDELEINVIDNGIGISAEFLPDVFERFRQERSISTKNGGLGLGLAIVRNLIETHGGSVEAFSEGENKGSRFTVRLPFHSLSDGRIYERAAIEQAADSL